MKRFLMLAALAVAGASVAHAQEAGQPAIAADSLLTPTASRAPDAGGWHGPVDFSPIAVADLIVDVCRSAVSGDGAALSARAVELGLGEPQSPPEELAHALPPGAVTWRVPSIDGVVFLFGYGETPLSCGAAILRPLSEDGFNKVTALLQDSKVGFASDSTQILQGDVRWERLKSPKGEFIDVMEYPAKKDRPGILRADFLPG